MFYSNENKRLNRGVLSLCKMFLLCYQSVEEKAMVKFSLILFLLCNLYFKRLTPITMKSNFPSGPLKTKLMLMK